MKSHRGIDVPLAFANLQGVWSAAGRRRDPMKGGALYPDVTYQRIGLVAGLSVLID